MFMTFVCVMLDVALVFGVVALVAYVFSRMLEQFGIIYEQFKPDWDQAPHTAQLHYETIEYIAPPSPAVFPATEEFVGAPISVESCVEVPSEPRPLAIAGPVDRSRSGDSVTVTVPAALAAPYALLFFDSVLEWAGPNVSEIKFCRGRSAVMTELGAAARQRGCETHWVASDRFEEAGWVVWLS